VVPSLQVTGPLLLEAPLAEEELLAAGAAAAAGASVLVDAPAEADLLMPPCPLQAPRPPCGEVVPSLQVTGPLVLLCANEGAGAAISVAARAAALIKALSLTQFIAVPPCEVPLVVKESEYSKDYSKEYSNHTAGDLAVVHSRARA
jgi:hypothetical protein